MSATVTRITVSAIIPCLNEESTIAAVASAVTDTLSPAFSEVDFHPCRTRLFGLFISME